jgi:hypothetical protein
MDEITAGMQRAGAFKVFSDDPDGDLVLALGPVDDLTAGVHLANYAALPAEGAWGTRTPSGGAGWPGGISRLPAERSVTVSRHSARPIGHHAVA